MLPEEDREALSQFIYSVQQDLQLVTTNLTDISPEAEWIVSEVEAAWEAVLPHFEEIDAYLRGKRPFDGLDRLLENRGLTGAQLRLKLKLYGRRKEDFYGAFSDFQAASPDDKAEKRPKVGGGGLLGKLFKMINKVLESLGIVPGADAVKEFKGVLEEVT